jgi:hypothetical protein
MGIASKRRKNGSKKTKTNAGIFRHRSVSEAKMPGSKNSVDGGKKTGNDAAAMPSRPPRLNPHSRAVRAD